MKIRKANIIDVQEWDKTVEETYGRTYSFQQQDGCKDRGFFYLTVPETPEDYENEIVPEIVNHEERGVSFKAWLERDPKQPLADGRDDYTLRLWWERNFYPDVQMVANDLCKKGILEEGNYIIEIDW